MMTFRTCSIALLATAALAGTALADGTVRMNNGATGYNSFTATSQSGYNGENSGPGSNGSNFQTFCLQANEFFTPGQTYTSIISTYTVAEGRSNYDPSGPTAATSSGRDYLSSTTALLYSTFRAGGTFGGFAPSGSSALTTALQLAIWYSEGELNNVTSTGNTTYADYSTYTGNTAAVAMYNWARTNNDGSLYNVRVLQLYNSNGSNAQDQLTILSPAQLLNFVPLPPAAFAGLGTLAGVIGIGYIRRRRLAAV